MAEEKEKAKEEKEEDSLDQDEEKEEEKEKEEPMPLKMKAGGLKNILISHGIMPTGLSQVGTNPSRIDNNQTGNGMSSKWKKPMLLLSRARANLEENSSRVVNHHHLFLVKVLVNLRASLTFQKVENLVSPRARVKQTK